MSTPVRIRIWCATD